jgi:hypothetical protein
MKFFVVLASVTAALAQAPGVLVMNDLPYAVRYHVFDSSIDLFISDPVISCESHEVTWVGSAPPYTLLLESRP